MANPEKSAIDHKIELTQAKISILKERLTLYKTLKKELFGDIPLEDEKD